MKIVPIILLVIILAVGGVAGMFYKEKQDLEAQYTALNNERTQLLQENEGLKRKYTSLQREKQALEERWSKVKSELTRLEEDRNTWQKKYNSVLQERDLLAERLKSSPVRTVSVTEKKPTRTTTVPTAAPSDEHWVDIVRAKAELEAQISDLKSDLADAKSSAAELEKLNKELNIKVDDLADQNEDLVREVDFKTRTLDIMSRDLVNERETRKKVTEELAKTSRENVSLKRKLLLANKEKLQLQNQIKKTVEKKENLTKKISGIETILKEKSLALQELQDQLNKAIAGDSILMSPQQATSVELPPIVVKPDTTGVKGLHGEVIAVNQDEKFIVIDRGESSGVRPGFQFKVMRGDKYIATAEVIETRRDISAADIKEVASGYTIQEGDKVISK